MKSPLATSTGATRTKDAVMYSNETLIYTVPEKHFAIEQTCPSLNQDAMQTHGRTRLLRTTSTYESQKVIAIFQRQNY